MKRATRRTYGAVLSSLVLLAGGTSAEGDAEASRASAIAHPNRVSYGGIDGTTIDGYRCGTPDPTRAQMSGARSAARDYLEERREFAGGLINVAFHVVRHNDGVMGEVTDTQIADQIQILNDA